MNPQQKADALNESINEFEQAANRFMGLVRSGVLAGVMDTEYADEVRRLQRLLLIMRARLYQVAAKERAREGSGPLRDDLLAMLDELDEGLKGDTDVVTMPSVHGSGKGPGLRILRGADDPTVRGV